MVRFFSLICPNFSKISADFFENCPKFSKMVQSFPRNCPTLFRRLIKNLFLKIFPYNSWKNSLVYQTTSSMFIFNSPIFQGNCPISEDSSISIRYVMCGDIVHSVAKFNWRIPENETFFLIMIRIGSVCWQRYYLVFDKIIYLNQTWSS